MRITFLGTGTSHGIPVIGCTCPVCTSRDPRDRRVRAGLAISERGTTVLVDAPPELRLSLLAAGIGRADALLLTHAHADHIAGLDDVRIFSEREKRKFPIYGPAPALRQVRQRFNYVFRNTQKGGGKPRLSLHPITRPVTLNQLRIVPIPLWHGRVRVFGYRIRGFAYLTDVSVIPPASYRALKGLDVVVLDALRREPHETHFNLEQAVEAARRIGAKKTYFTHMCHRLGHQVTEKRLPARMRLAYDGLTLTV